MFIRCDSAEGWNGRKGQRPVQRGKFVFVICFFICATHGLVNQAMAAGGANATFPTRQTREGRTHEEGEEPGGAACAARAREGKEELGRARCDAEGNTGRSPEPLRPRGDADAPPEQGKCARTLGR